MHVLKGRDDSVLWSYVVEETRVPGGNHWPSTVKHYPIEPPGMKQWQEKDLPLHYPGHFTYHLEASAQPSGNLS